MSSHLAEVGAIDVTGINYFLPVISFILVFIVSFAVLNKTKIFENKGLELFVSFLISTLFITTTGGRPYLETIVPWFAILLISLFFILVMTGFIGDKADFLKKWFGVVFVFLLFIVFLVSAFFVFSSSISPYLPGGDESKANPYVLDATSWIFNSRSGGALLLLLVSALVSWILVRSVKEKKSS